MLNRIAAAAIVAALTIVPSVAFGTAATKLSIDPTLGAPSAQYHLNFDGHLWNGEHKEFAHDISLTRTSDTAVHALVTKLETQQKVDFTATRQADGTLVPAIPSEQFGAFNTIARLVHGAPASLAATSAWNAPVDVDLGDDVSTSVPVHAWVSKIDGDSTIVEGTGTQSTTVTYHGFTVPIDLTIKFASRFVQGSFTRLDYAASEVIHAGPQTQTVDWTVSLEHE
jgi:Spy/CpxP family protein refolding chaperone